MYWTLIEPRKICKNFIKTLVSGEYSVFRRKLIATALTKLAPKILILGRAACFSVLWDYQILYHSH